MLPPAEQLENEYEFDPEDLKEVCVYDVQNDMHRVASSFHKEQWIEAPSHVQRCRNPNTGQCGHSVLVVSGLRKMIREELQKLMADKTPPKRPRGRPRKETVAEVE